MKRIDVLHAEFEASRFLERVKQLKANTAPDGGGRYRASKYSGAVRRASMDLTRALADMRKT